MKAARRLLQTIHHTRDNSLIASELFAQRQNIFLSFSLQLRKLSTTPTYQPLEDVAVARYLTQGQSCRSIFPAYPHCNGQLQSIRHASSSTGRSHGRVNLSPAVAEEIGRRARRRQTQRMWMLVLGGTAVAGVVIAGLSALEENLMFYITPTQALEKHSLGKPGRRMRLGGLVKEGSVRIPLGSTETEFVVTDLVTEILVRHRGALPDLFREGHSVVAEGFLRPLPHALPASAPLPATLIHTEAGRVAATAAAATTAAATTAAANNMPPSEGKAAAAATAAAAGLAAAEGQVAGGGPTAGKEQAAEDSMAASGFPSPAQVVRAAMAGKVASAEALVERGNGRVLGDGKGGEEEGEEGVSQEEDLGVTGKARELGLFFAATEVLAKHDEKYMPKEVAAAIERNRAALEGDASENNKRVEEVEKIKSMSNAAFKGEAGGSKKKEKVGQSPKQAAAYDL